MKTLTPLLASYIETAFWSSVDDNGEPLDRNYSSDSLSNEAVNAMEADLLDFVEANKELITLSGLSESSVAHNFWLNRNRHGAGFWDLGLGAVGNYLSDAAKVYGSQDLYIGDDGSLYV